MTRIDLRSVEEGYFWLAIATDASPTLAQLKKAVEKTPFELKDVEWRVSGPPPPEPESSPAQEK